MIPQHSRLAGACALLVACAVSPTAHAEPHQAAHGRFQGDVDLSASLGAEIAKGGPGVAAQARLFYLGSAGVYLAYADGLGSKRPVRRSIAFGIGVRPLFLPRWGSDLERGPRWLDLTVDSIALDLGLFLAEREQGDWASAPGLEAGLGAEIPLVGRAAGPWIGLRGALRWSSAALAASTPGEPLAALGFVTLTWHVVTAAHLVDSGDSLLR
jgi:hypothetical protein